MVFAIAAALAAAGPAVGSDAPTAKVISTTMPTHVQPVQYAQCWHQVGPFATQDRAWSYWRQARGQGYAVSNGVIPCWSGGARGYCFRVYAAC
jgi:hypothetical protein